MFKYKEKIKKEKECLKESEEIYKGIVIKKGEN